MKKRATFTIDEDLYYGLQRVPRGFSVSEFVNFMLRGMLKEFQGAFPSQSDFEKWVNSDPELKKVREGMREAWGPTLQPVFDKVDNMADSFKNAVSTTHKRSATKGKTLKVKK